MLYRYQKSLKEIYNEYLIKYKNTGIKPYPDKLLALLLLQEKDNFEPLMTSEGNFYNVYKKEINEKIEQVISDFNLTKEDIIRFIEEKGLLYQEENYEHDKIWLVFASGFGVMHWSIMYHPSYTPEKAYDMCYNCFKGQYRKDRTNIRKKTLIKYNKKQKQR